ncbi:hypothetical protein KA977_12010, partial [Candidatus Dependentiae bacterium]|nr:hypothetical protein [Candidatus Dependentiae bacterium]
PGASYARFYYSTYSSFYYYGNTSYITPTGDYIECAVPYSNSYITNNGINYWYAQIYYPNNSSIRFPASMYFQFDSFSNYFAANPTPDINQLISQNVYSVENGQFFKIYAPGASYARFYYSTYSSFYYYGNTSYITPTGDYIECTVPYSNSYITNNGINYWYAQIYFPNNTNFRFPISGYFYFPVATSYTISNPLPANNSTVTPGANGQNFKIYAPAAKYARIYYSTYSSFYNYNYTSNISPTGGYIECTIPYSNSYITNKGINYWYVQIYYNYDTVRYPLSGYLNFTVN